MQQLHGATRACPELKRGATRACPELRNAAAFLQRFVVEARSEASESRREGFRVVVVTSTLEDWLHRGTHPVLVSMSLQVYAVWVYRVEKTSGLKSYCSSVRQLDFEFASHYVLHATHTQRLATEFRVPLFEGSRCLRQTRIAKQHPCTNSYSCVPWRLRVRTNRRTCAS